LGIVLHPSFKSFLRKARFDGTAFMRARFSFGIQDTQINYLRLQNVGERERLIDRVADDRKRYLDVGVTTDNFVLDNEDGSIYVFNHDAANPKLELVAGDAEALVCALASIADVVMGTDDEYRESQELKDFVEMVTREIDHIYPNEFWHDFARGVT
jgi:hypothetical protein